MKSVVASVKFIRHSSFLVRVVVITWSKLDVSKANNSSIATMRGRDVSAPLNVASSPGSRARTEGGKESLVHNDHKFHHVRLLPPSALSSYDAQ